MNLWKNEVASDTILFKNAVGSYENFISTEIATETIPYIKCYDVTTREPMDYTEYLPNVYRLLIREFRNSQINFTNVDDFLDMLWSVIENHTPNFIERYNQYQKLLTLSDDELTTLGTSIVAMVDNTNERVDNPLKDVINYVTAQQSSRTYSDKPTKIRSQIYSSQMTIIEDYLNNFRWLFIRFNCSFDGVV